MKLIPHRLTGTVFNGYSEFDSIWYRSRSPHRISALPPIYNRYRCASTHFEENQLAPGSIGISPLTTPHPPPFSTVVGSDLHLVLPKLHPGHG